MSKLPQFLKNAFLSKAGIGISVAASALALCILFANYEAKREEQMSFVPSASVVRMKNHNIYLQGLQLSTKQKASFLKVVVGVLSTNDLPSSVELGMGNVPVLNQGVHGACVTFANTAAIDAILFDKDYISQLCTLELGLTFSSHGYGDSGWEGTEASAVLNQLLQFGAVPKTQESKILCGGFKSYPLDNSKQGYALSLVKYHKYSQSIINDIEWFPLLSLEERLGKNPTAQYDANTLIRRIKTSFVEAQLHPEAASRVTIAFALYGDAEMAGAVSKHNVPQDTWSLTKELQTSKQDPDSAHEVLITGYDDNAVVTDPDGAVHKGVFTIRNSWGPTVGDKGNFYMTYDYFASYVLEANLVIKTS